LIVQLSAPTPAAHPDESKEAFVESLRDAAAPRLAAGRPQFSHMAKPRPPLGGLKFPGSKQLSARRVRRIGTAVRFVARLRERGILREEDALGEFLVAHRVQKYAYISSKLGVRLGYKFEFLEFGAHSGDLALDLHSHLHGRNGDDPFEEIPGALDALEDIVRERRDTRWLQMATFAIRDLHTGETKDEFVARMLGGRLGYTKRAAEDAFERVRTHATSLGVDSQ